jgi:hypothetical protein
VSIDRMYSEMSVHVEPLKFTVNVTSGKLIDATPCRSSARTA